MRLGAVSSSVHKDAFLQDLVQFNYMLQVLPCLPLTKMKCKISIYCTVFVKYGNPTHVLCDGTKPHILNENISIIVIMQLGLFSNENYVCCV